MTNKSRWRMRLTQVTVHKLTFALFTFLTHTFLLNSAAQAASVRLGLLAGLGSAAMVDTSLGVIGAQNPAGFSIIAEYPTSPRLSIGFEHARSLSFAPFSSGIGLFEACVRWHFLVDAP